MQFLILEETKERLLVSLKYHHALLKGLRSSLLPAWKEEFLGFEVNDLRDPFHSAFAPVYAQLIDLAIEEQVTVDYNKLIDQLMKGITREAEHQQSLGDTKPLLDLQQVYMDGLLSDLHEVYDWLA